MNKLFYFGFIIILIGSCIEPIAIDTANEPQTLVVDGIVTTDPGPYNIRLSYSKGYEDFSNRPLSGAKITIYDSEGSSEILAESPTEGLYRTKPDGIQGKIGNSYYITIETPDGQLYESIPETLNPTTKIDSIYYELKTELEYKGQFSQGERSYFQIYADVSDPQGERNFYRWETNRVMEFTSRAADGGPPPTCCFRCFLFYNDSEIAITNDERQDGQKLSRIPIEQVGNGFSNLFSVRVKQYSLTPRAYEFWSNIDEQRNSVGSIFDPPPSVIRGNIFNKNNTEELVLGYFGASDVSRKTKIIPRPSYPVVGRVKYETIGDCRDVEGATADVPQEFK